MPATGKTGMMMSLLERPTHAKQVCHICDCSQLAQHLLCSHAVHWMPFKQSHTITKFAIMGKEVLSSSRPEW